MESLEGKVAFITGGSSGIGLGIAHALRRAGMKVAISGRNLARLQAALDSFGGPTPEVYPLQVDVTDRTAMAAAAQDIQRRFGKVHVLCNNAGAGILVPISRATYNDWDWAIAVNIGGVVNGLSAFLPQMLAHGEDGHVVSTSSMAGLFHGSKAGIYTTTKYAVVGMMESLRAELEPCGIGVSVFCPGVVNTNFHESECGRPAQFAEEGRAQSPEVLASIKRRVIAKGMDPREAGERVLEGIRRNDLYILSHPEYGQGVVERFEAILASMPHGEQPVPAERLEIERGLGLLSHAVYVKERDRRRSGRAAASADAQIGS